MEIATNYENCLHLRATELKLGLPGRDEFESTEHNLEPANRSNKRASPESDNSSPENNPAPAAKAQVVGWPPVRSYRKNAFRQNNSNPEADAAGMYVKVSMDGAPYLRKIDLNIYRSYPELLLALQNMFKCTIGVYSEREGYNGSEYEPTYEDKDGDWMLVGDVPWEMFITSCKRLRIMKNSEKLN